MLPLDLLVFGFRQRNVLLSFANRLGPHELLKARRGEDKRQVNDFAPDVGDRDPRIDRNEYRRAAVHLSLGVSQMHPSGSALQKQDFVCAWVSVRIDSSPRFKVFRAEHQMRRTTILRVDF